MERWVILFELLALLVCGHLGLRTAVRYFAKEYGKCKTNVLYFLILVCLSAVLMELFLQPGSGAYVFGACLFFGQGLIFLIGYALGLLAKSERTA